MANKAKKSLSNPKTVALSFSGNDAAIMKMANEVLQDLEALSNEARYMMSENPESKGNITLWNYLVDIEDMVTTLSEGNTLSKEDIEMLGNTCIEVIRHFNRNEEVSNEEVKAIFAKLNNVIFENDFFA